MSKHAYKNDKQQDSKNRINTVTSVGPETSYQAKTQEVHEAYNAQEIPAEDIQKRAYEIYQQKGGFHIDNWLEAERILREEHRSASK